MRKALLIISALSLSLSLSGDAHAVQYHFSGAACRPEQSSDATYALTNGAGISNTDGRAFAPLINVVCPVVGMETSTQRQTELRARLWDGNGPLAIGGFWQIDHIGTGTIWWSSIKYACSASTGCSSNTGYTGGGYVIWTGSELLPYTASSFLTYSFRAMIPGRCYDDQACYSQSWVQAYWTTHDER